MWRTLESLRDRGLPKLFHLRRAKRAGVSVPETVWAAAGDLVPERCPLPPFDAPWIVRSASPTEDTTDTSAAGQFVSCNVDERDEDAFRRAVADVVASLPLDHGKPQGAVFVQPLLRPEAGGVCFFDGFYYERTSAAGGNQELTAGTARGEIARGTLLRGEAWSDWLARLARVYRGELERGVAMDFEFCRTGEHFILLQARPALFELQRNPLLSLANHREILGDPPSPWIAGALEIAGRDALAFFAEVDPRIAHWNEQYALALGGRAWLNVSFFHRLMDHWGLPRTFVEEGIGGHGTRKEDSKLLWPRFLAAGPRLIALQWKNLATILASARALKRFRADIDEANDLAELLQTTARGLALALRTNFAINGALTGLVRVRQALGLRGRARVTTEEMMHAYEELRALPEKDREPALAGWLERFGHRGPLESDPARPRFHELQDVLLQDLQGAEQPATSAPLPPRGGFLFALDRRRESFRDDLMRAWDGLRRKILEGAHEHVSRGTLERVEDVFLLNSEDLREGAWPSPEQWATRRSQHEQLATRELPSTAPRETIEHALHTETSSRGADAKSFQGFALSRQSFEGQVRKASDLVTLLREEAEGGMDPLGPQTVLLVPALEPSWAVVFGRVGAVLTELGGELSHASILLREAKKPAIVNCPGIFSALRNGDRVRLDGSVGYVEALS